MDEEAIIIPESSDDELLKLYDRPGRRRADDAAAMQAALCIILAIMFLIAGFVFPELAAGLLRKVNELSESRRELFPNPIIFIERLF